MTEPIRPAVPQPGMAAPAAPPPSPYQYAYLPAPAAGYAVPGQPLGYRPGYQPALRPTGPGGQPLAEFWERLVAYLLDSLVVGAITLIPIVVSGFLIFRRVFEQINTAVEHGKPVDATSLLGSYALFWALIVILQILTTFGYEAIYLVRRGQTVGKRVMKIQVVRVDGGPLDLGTTVRRWALQYLLAFVPVWQWIDGLWQLWDQPYRQCLHDKGAKTLVVKVVP